MRRRDILSHEEIVKLTQAAVLAGISKIRLTGGEPMVRKGMLGLCRRLSEIEGLDGIAMTTNGILLENMAEDIFKAGVRRINVSLDSLNRKRFEKITGFDGLPRVMAGIERAEILGISPIKINTVVMRGINDGEIEDFVRLTVNKPYHVRFIELMPTEGWASDDHASRFISSEDTWKKIKEMGDVQILPSTDSYGPAKLFALKGAKGKIGLITPMSQHFCGDCNRMRLTADGKLRTCLFSKKEIDIKNPLRKGASLVQLSEVFKTAAFEKPLGHRLNENTDWITNGRPMRAIGG
jgi:cyclic pyranopterin phosphate synthase